MKHKIAMVMAATIVDFSIVDISKTHLDVEAHRADGTTCAVTLHKEVFFNSGSEFVADLVMEALKHECNKKEITGDGTVSTGSSGNDDGGSRTSMGRHLESR